MRVVALISFRLPVIDKRGEEIAIARGVGGIYLARHLRCLLIGIVEEILLARHSAGKGYARFGLPGKTAVRACCGGEFHIVIDYRLIAHKVESAGVTGGKLGTVTVLGSTGSGFLRAVSRSCQGIAAVGDGDGERCGIVSTGQGKLLLRAAGQQQCRRPKGM